MPSRTMRRLYGSTGAVLLATTLAACAGEPNDPAGATSQQPSAGASTQPVPTPAPTPDPVVLKPNIKNGATNVKVNTVVTVKASSGILTKVKLSYTNTDRRGRKQQGTVAGKISKNRTTWTAGDRLEPATAYRLISTGKNTVNQPKSTTTTFRTHNLTLNQQTYPQLYPLKGSQVGVGMPVVLTFDVPVKNKREFEKNLHVTSSPSQAGSWHWYSSKEVRYRPKKFWTPATKFNVATTINAANAG